MNNYKQLFLFVQEQTKSNVSVFTNLHQHKTARIIRKNKINGRAYVHPCAIVSLMPPSIDSPAATSQGLLLAIPRVRLA